MLYPRPGLDAAGSAVVSQAGGLLLTETIRTVGLDPGLCEGAGTLAAIDRGARSGYVARAAA